jgi:DNA-binding transcriptional MerR regulator
MGEQEYTLAELSEASATPARTIRYYIQKRILPGPSGRGPKSRYDAAHLDTLRIIRLCQDRGMSLGAIREELERRRELAALAAAWERGGVKSDDPERGPQNAGTGLRSGRPPVDLKRSGPEAGAPRSVRRSHWERITLTSAIELHVRRPLPVNQRKALGELLEVAERLFPD